MRADHRAVLAALALPDDDDSTVEVNILHPQLQGLADAQPGAVQQLPQHEMRTFQLLQQPSHFDRRQHHGQPGLTLWPPDCVHPRQIHAQHLTVEEQQGRQRLPVRGCRHSALGRQP
jgi:hypothetical protein